MSTKQFTVPNIGCIGCVKTIESEVGAIDGVSKVKADLATKSVLVEWNSPATWDKIQVILVDIEYPPAE